MLEDHLGISLFWNVLSIDPSLFYFILFCFVLFLLRSWSGVRLNSFLFIYMHALFSFHLFRLVFLGMLSITFVLVIWVEMFLEKLRFVP